MPMPMQIQPALQQQPLQQQQQKPQSLQPLHQSSTVTGSLRQFNGTGALALEQQQQPRTGFNVDQDGAAASATSAYSQHHRQQFQSQSQPLYQQQQRGGLHLGAKVALAILLGVILLVVSATIADLSSDCAKTPEDALAAADADAEQAVYNAMVPLSHQHTSQLQQQQQQHHLQLPQARDQRSPSLSSSSSSSLFCSANSFASASVPILGTRHHHSASAHHQAAQRNERQLAAALGHQQHQTGRMGLAGLAAERPAASFKHHQLQQQQQSAKLLRSCATDAKRQPGRRTWCRFAAAKAKGKNYHLNLKMLFGSASGGAGAGAGAEVDASSSCLSTISKQLGQPTISISCGGVQSDDETHAESGILDNANECGRQKGEPANLLETVFRIGHWRRQAAISSTINASDHNLNLNNYHGSQLAEAKQSPIAPSSAQVSDEDDYDDQEDADQEDAEVAECARGGRLGNENRQSAADKSCSSSFRRQLLKQIFLSFSLRHSASLIFQTSKPNENEHHHHHPHHHQQQQQVSPMFVPTCGGGGSNQVDREFDKSYAYQFEDHQSTVGGSTPGSFKCQQQQQPQQKQQQSQSIDSLHGLRFLSMIWIIVIHSYDFALRWSFFTSTSSLDNIYKTAASQLLANGTFACDSFFFAAGFLLPYLAFPAFQGNESERQREFSSSSSGSSSSSQKQEHKQQVTASGETPNTLSSTTSVARLTTTTTTTATTTTTTAKATTPISRLVVAPPQPPPSAAADDSSSSRYKQDTRSTNMPSCSSCSTPDTIQLSAQLEQDSLSNSGSANAVGGHASTCLSLFGADSAPHGQIINTITTTSSHHQHGQLNQAQLAWQRQQQHQANVTRLPANHENGQQQQQQQQQQQRRRRDTTTTTTTTTNVLLNTNEFTFNKVLSNVLHRYIRMMPLMMAIIGLSATLLRYLGEGPAWEDSTMMFDKWCRSNWWINALFLHNFLNRENMCLSHSWYSAVDIQLFLLGQLILFALFKSRKIGLFLCCSFLIGAQLITGALTLWHHLPAVPLIANYAEQSVNLYYGEVYIKPYCRASPYLIGILLAYLMRTTSLGQVKLKRWQVTTGWLSSITILLAILLAMQPAMNGQQPSELQSALYSALSRPIWACATGWMIFACITNHGGIFESILSARFFVPLSRLNYPAFLIHPIVMAVFYGSRQTSFHFSHYLMLYLILGNIVITYASAFILSALFELPLLSAERAIKRALSKRKEERRKRLSSSSRRQQWPTTSTTK